MEKNLQYTRNKSFSRKFLFTKILDFVILNLIGYLASSFS